MNFKQIVMPIVIKEIVIKTTVTQEKERERENVVSAELLEQLKEEILREIPRNEYIEYRRRER